MIQRIPKNRHLQKGQYLSNEFFQRQISENLSDISRRIRDIIDYEKKRKGQRKIILEEQEYLKQFFKSYSLNSTCNFGDVKIDTPQNSLKIIDQKFILDYPLFFQPKWKIFFDEEPSLDQLAMLNRLAYGYFYEQSQKGQIVSLLKQTEDSTIYIFEGFIFIQIGTLKIFNEKRSQFIYFDFIEYKSKKDNFKKCEVEDPRKFFNSKELIIFDQSQSKSKKSKIQYMTVQKLRERITKFIEPYNSLKYCNSYPKPNQIQEYLFKLKTFLWFSQNQQIEKGQLILYEQKRQKDQNDLELQNFMVKNIFNFASSAKLVQLLQKIPNFQYKLSQQQRQVIQIRENLIVIGRSGTGKTICALLRLFSLETLFKIKTIGVKNFKSIDLDNSSQMRNIFLTFSPFLIEQIKGYYQKHQNLVRFSLEKKQGVSSILNSKLTKKQNSVQNLNHLTQFDYPGFFTVNNFLIMLDGCYKENYFQRNESGNLNICDQQEEIRYKKKQIFWFKDQNNIYSKGQQINYEYFRDIFWYSEIQKRKQLKNLSSHVVWTQIYSEIQGSTRTHRCAEYCISQETYVNQSKNFFLTLDQKRQVYSIFKLYKNWKKSLHKFDQMDVVNFLLNKIRRNTYLGPVINHLFIDEVQDLTAATIYLLSQIASNHLFYSGDTAQSIIKGVNLKFSDIRQMFCQDSKIRIENQKQPVMKQLTVNFRSQSSILKIANSLVKILELIFPKTIDKLRKQISSNQGPIPLIAKNYEEIKQILKIGGSDQYNNQIILVRNEQGRKEAKKQFKNSLVITIQESKGLQFDDVVIWKLNQKQKLEKLWRIIDYLQVFEINQNHIASFISQKCSKQDQIQHRLNVSKNIQQIKLNQYTEICSEIKLLYTAVTRAKDLLIFYDSLPNRLLELFRKLQLVGDYSLKENEQITEFKYLKKQTLIKSNKTKENSVALYWKNIGTKFYLEQNFQSALICFGNINDSRMCHEIQIRIKVKEGQKLIQRLKINELMKQKNIYSEKQLQRQRKAIKQIFIEAARRFEQIELFIDAGKAYYLSQNYQKALNIFGKFSMFIEMASCYIKLKQFMKAAEMYEHAKRYEKTVEYLKKGNKMVSAYVKLVEYKELFKKKYREEKEQLKRNIFKEIEKQIQQISQDKLKIVLFFDENTQIPFQQFMLTPLNISYTLNQLEIKEYFYICYLISAKYSLFRHIQDYFAVGLWAEYYTFTKVLDFYKRQSKRKWAFINNRRNERISQKVDNQIRRFNQILSTSYQSKNKIIDNLVHNLILCGFSPNCSIFFNDQKDYHRIFMEDQKYLQKINLKLVRQQYLFKQISFLPNTSVSLKRSQIIHTFQIFFRVLMEQVYKIQLTENQKNKIKQDLKNRLQELTQRKQQIRILKIYLNGLQKEKNIISKQCSSKMKDLETIILQENKCKEQLKKKDILLREISILQHKKNLVNRSSFQKFFNIRNSELDNFILKQQELKNRVQKIQNQEKIIKQQKKLKERELQILLKAYKQKGSEINKIQEEIEEQDQINKQLSKYKQIQLYEKKLIRKQLSQKTLRQSKKLFKVNVRQLSDCFQKFCSFQPLSKDQLKKILDFNLQQKQEIFLCQICTLVLSLLLKYEYFAKNLDQISGYPNTLRLIKKMNSFKQFQEFESEDEAITLTYEVKQKLRNCMVEIKKFYSKILSILNNPELNKRFYQILIGFLSCHIFQNQDQKLLFLQGFAIIKTTSVIIWDLLTEQNSRKLGFFDQNYQILIGKKQTMRQLLTDVIFKTFKKQFQCSFQKQKVTTSKATIKENSRNFLQYNPEILELERKILSQEIKNSKNIEKLKQQIFFGNSKQGDSIWSKGTLFKKLGQMRNLSEEKSKLSFKRDKLQQLNVYDRNLIKIFFLEAQKQLERKFTENKCSICCQPFQNLILQCQHKFHLLCILTHVKIKHNTYCPSCQDDLYSQKMIWGKCQHCNSQHVKFNLRNFVQQDKQNLLCQYCISTAKQRKIVFQIYD